MKVLDIFSGSGGFTLGLEKSGMNTVAFCEIEDYAQRVLKKHWPHIPIYSDVTKITSDQLKSDNIEFDVICGGFPCFAKGTHVITTTGLVPIEDLKLGDLVLTHKNRYRPVIQTMNRISDHSIRMKVMGAPDIVTTDEHPFLCKEDNNSPVKWISVSKLKKGMQLAIHDKVIGNINYTWVNITDINRIEKSIQVFNIGVEEDETYTANGIICHNCQDISIAGKNKGIIEGERSGLWREFRRLIDETKPKYAIIENVSALLGRGLNVVLSDLASIGYDATWTTLDSQYFGVPQRRRRVYILAVRDGIPHDSDIFRIKQRSDSNTQRQIIHINQSRRWNFTQSNEYPFAYFTRQRSDQFSEKGVASTIMKRDYKDFTDLIVDDNGIRRLSIQERLLLQGYDKNFFDDIDLTITQSYMLNGMTVPVVKWLGDCIMDFEKTGSKSPNSELFSYE